METPAVGFVGFGGDDFRGFKRAQAIGEDVGGDAFARFFELLEGAVAADHDVADDEQGPAVAEQVE